MQLVFADDDALRQAFLTSLSAPRFGTYLRMAAGDERHAIAFYHWNAQLSQSLGTCLQAWEVCLRNRLNEILQRQIDPGWPYYYKMRRELNADGKRRLDEVIERLERTRERPAPFPAIISDLSAGFWVSLLARGYETSFAWHRNRKNLFPNNHALTLSDAHTWCDEVRSLRNRIAHHEPILQLPLDERRERIGTLIHGMCTGTHAYVEQTCTFAAVWNARPTNQSTMGEMAEASDGAAAEAVPHAET